MLEQLLALSGLIATVWISLGVYIAAKFYPNYNHRQQFCSELGAAGSPTQTLSPLINNYPLGFIFCAFGGYLLALPENNWALTLSGVMIIVHGLGTWVAGFFPMDKDPYTETPSNACQIHSWPVFLCCCLCLSLRCWSHSHQRQPSCRLGLDRYQYWRCCSRDISFINWRKSLKKKALSVCTSDYRIGCSFFGLAYYLFNWYLHEKAVLLKDKVTSHKS